MEEGKYRNMEIWKFRNMEILKYGYMEIWKYGNMENDIKFAQQILTLYKLTHLCTNFVLV